MSEKNFPKHDVLVNSCIMFVTQRGDIEGFKTKFDIYGLHMRYKSMRIDIKIDVVLSTETSMTLCRISVKEWGATVLDASGAFIDGKALGMKAATYVPGQWEQEMYDV